MKNILQICALNSRNNYFYDRNEKRLVFVHPLLKNIIMLADSGVDIVQATDEELQLKNPSYSLEEVSYYKRKYKHWFSSHFYDTNKQYHVKYSTKINPDDVKKQLANISQIVFEVTDNCNLKCFYCGYGELYDFYDERNRVNLPREKVFALLDFFIDLWNSDMNMSIEKEVYISFYGGEPLMNMPLIKEIIAYLTVQKPLNIVFSYNMTTNAVLLLKHVDFLVEHKIKLLISLDGDKMNNSYRVYKNGKEAFDLICTNIRYLQEHYPDYFEKHVGFNAVLHNRNSVAEIHRFISHNFGKLPRIGELNPAGVRSAAKKQFYQTYRNTIESLHQHEDYALVEEEMFVLLPDSRNLVYFIHQYTGNVYNDYLDLLFDHKKQAVLPTGTCFPFSRKLFVTTNGKLLQCEQIAHQYALGKIPDNNIVVLDYKSIADRYNDWYSKLERQCKHCLRLGACGQCMFYINGLESKGKCPGFATEIDLLSQVASTITYLEEKPEDYKRIFEEITIK